MGCISMQMCIVLINEFLLLTLNKQYNFREVRILVDCRTCCCVKKVFTPFSGRRTMFGMNGAFTPNGLP